MQILIFRSLDIMQGLRHLAHVYPHIDRSGIFLWVKLPDNVDTLKLYQAALKEGVAINPGPEWSTDANHSKSRMRLCFASPSHEDIRKGIAVLADVCRREFGVPERSANIERGA